MMNNDQMTGTGDETTQQQNESESNQNVSPQEGVEKGSGYGPPNEGSGESVTKEDLSPDGQVLNGAGTVQQSGEPEQ